jgi:hypothetical protein
MAAVCTAALKRRIVKLNNITITLEIKAPEIVEAIKSLFSLLPGVTAGKEIGPNPDAPKQDVPAAEKIEPQTAPTPSDAPVATTTGEPKTFTLDEVRSRLSKLSRAGKDVKGLISKFGVVKLTAIPAGKFGEVMGLADKLERGEAI